MSDDESSPVIDYYFAKSQAGRTGQNKFHNEVLPRVSPNISDVMCSRQGQISCLGKIRCCHVFLSGELDIFPGKLKIYICFYTEYWAFIKDALWTFPFSLTFNTTIFKMGTMNWLKLQRRKLKIRRPTAEAEFELRSCDFIICNVS